MSRLPKVPNPPPPKRKPCNCGDKGVREIAKASALQHRKPDRHDPRGERDQDHGQSGDGEVFGEPTDGGKGALVRALAASSAEMVRD